MTRVIYANIHACFDRKDKLTKHSTSHIVGAHRNYLIKISNEWNVSWPAQHWEWTLKNHSKSNLVVSMPLFQIVVSNKIQCLVETVLSFRIFVRTGRDVFENRESFIFGREQTTSFINDRNTEAVIRPVNLGTSSGWSKWLTQ